VLQPNVNVAMVSLLDDRVQYFLAGAEEDNIAFPEVTLESRRWYACDEVIHHDEFCGHMIAIDLKQHPSAIYEELDMVRNDQTKNLPFVNGTTSGFCHYAGAPVVTEARLNAVQRGCLTKTASDIIRQPVQAVQAVEGGRTMRCHSALASLLQQRTSFSKLPTDSRTPLEVVQCPDPVSQFCGHAAETMRKAFDFDSVCFQDIPVACQGVQNTSGSQHGHLLATSLKAGVNTAA
jgi:hypothetical protein